MDVYRKGPETKRLSLRAMTTDDAEAVYAFNSNEQVMRWTGEPRLSSVEEAKDLLARYPDFETVGYGRWGCYVKAEDKLIGFCGLKYLDDLDEVDLGYRLLPDYWGKGYATEAGLACVKFGFDTLKLDRIIGLVLPENVASIRVLEKVGMRRECEFEYDGYRALRYSVQSDDRPESAG